MQDGLVTVRNGGHAAGRAAVAAAVEHPADGPRPGAGAAGLAFCRYADDWQRVRAQSGGGRACDAHGIRALPRGGPASTHQPGEKRRGTAVVESVPQLQRHGAAPATSAGRRPSVLRLPQRIRELMRRGAGAIARPHDRGPQPATAWLDQLLPAYAGSAGARGPRRVAAAPAALPVVAAVEAPGAPGAQAAPVGLE